MVGAVTPSTPIAAGTRVREYVGERIPAAEAIRREADLTRPAIFTLWLDEEQRHRRLGRRQREHLRQPLLRAQLRVGFRRGQAYVLALRDIAAGEEFTIDYAYDAAGPLERCGCGAKGCRGMLNSLAE